MVPLLIDMALTALTALVALLVVGMVIFFIYDSVVTLLEGRI